MAIEAVDRLVAMAPQGGGATAEDAPRVIAVAHAPKAAGRGLVVPNVRKGVLVSVAISGIAVRNLHPCPR